MTEAEWLACTDPERLMEYVYRQVTNRKVRLLACACCRRLGTAIPDPFRAILSAAECYADGLAPDEDMPSDYVAIGRLPRPAQAVCVAAFRNAHAGALANAVAEARWALTAGEEARFGEPHAIEASVQAALARDIFGNPFRPLAFDPRWRTADVTDLARTIYEGRAFDRMPVLADALMDAGCEDEQVIGHCRGPGPHVRGCWVVDLVLGKK